MSLHIESYGAGAPLVLLHGWGMHGGIWGSIVPRLAQRFQVHCVDLPGHGYSRASASDGNVCHHDTGRPCRDTPMLDAIVDVLSANFAGPVGVCGWSLGGIVAQRWALREPRKIARLILVASTPCFAGREDWQLGMATDALRQFAADLETNHASTLRRFLALQLRGSENERELLQRLREELFSRGEPDMKALRGGLEILRDVDLRSDLAAISQPVLAIAGARDKLTPPAASHYFAQVLPDARALEIAGAAHVPFLSHPDIFVERLTDFLHE